MKFANSREMDKQNSDLIHAMRSRYTLLPNNATSYVMYGKLIQYTYVQDVLTITRALEIQRYFDGTK